MYEFALIHWTGGELPDVRNWLSSIDGNKLIIVARNQYAFYDLMNYLLGAYDVMIVTSRNETHPNRKTLYINSLGCGFKVK